MRSVTQWRIYRWPIALGGVAHTTKHHYKRASSRQKTLGLSTRKLRRGGSHPTVPCSSFEPERRMARVGWSEPGKPLGLRNLLERTMEAGIGPKSVTCDGGACVAVSALPLRRRRRLPVRFGLRILLVIFLIVMAAPLRAICVTSHPNPAETA
jgi:hypothetical protein